MKYRKLDADGDYTLGTSNDFTQNKPETVAQSVVTRLQLLTGEWFLDVTDGTPWMTQILGNHSKQDVDSIIKDRILSTSGVTEIVSFDSVVTNRNLSIDATINTIYGIAIVSTLL